MFSILYYLILVAGALLFSVYLLKRKTAAAETQPAAPQPPQVPASVRAFLMARLCELLPNERAVLLWMDEDAGRPARWISERTGLSVKEVRIAQRGLRDCGAATYGPLWSDGAMAGTGYWLTEDGINLRDLARWRPVPQNDNRPDKAAA